jgi:hypothetical protein
MKVSLKNFRCRELCHRQPEDCRYRNPASVTAAENRPRNAGDEFAGYSSALESAWRAGNTVVQEITTLEYK